MTDKNQMIQCLTQICVTGDEFYPHCATFTANITPLDLINCYSFKINLSYCYIWSTLLVAQLVEALRYKPEGHGFDSQWFHRNFSLT
jgi:hypothetical protein